ncbi:MAG: hypothetical protein ACE5FL_13940 [Myxococcota bacterium]
MGTRRFDTIIEIGRANVLLHADAPDGPGAIRSALDRAEESANEFELRAFPPLVWIERARLAARIADDAEQQRALREALRIAREIGATGNARRIAQDLGES